MKVLITGARGFIGSALCRAMSDQFPLIALDMAGQPVGKTSACWERADITDTLRMEQIFAHHSPDVVIHCAGIAHQKAGKIDAAKYMEVNAAASERLARAAAGANHNVYFVFLSSVSVYGEQGLPVPVNEECRFSPSSDYAASKAKAERRLGELLERGVLGRLSILRLAPVYDRDWSLNLDRRVLAPARIAFLRFGSGSQRMTALARPNLVEFIEFLLGKKAEDRCMDVYNVCDRNPYDFNMISRILRSSGRYGWRPAVHIPLPVVWALTRLAGLVLAERRLWLHACYDKVAGDLIFDPTRMLMTGFVPRHTLQSVFP